MALIERERRAMAAFSVILVIHHEFPAFTVSGKYLHIFAGFKTYRMLSCAVDRFLRPMDDNTRLHYMTYSALQTFLQAQVCIQRGPLVNWSVRSLAFLKYVQVF